MHNFKIVKKIFLRTMLVAQVFALTFFAFTQTIPFMFCDITFLFKNSNFSSNFILNFASHYFLVVQSFQQIMLGMFVCELFIWGCVCPLIWFCTSKIDALILDAEDKHLTKLSNKFCINEYNLYILNNKLIC